MPRQTFPTTSSMLLIRQHYETIGLRDSWKWSAIEELAGLMGVEVIELFYLVGVSAVQASKFRRENKIPLVVAIHFHTMKDWYLHRRIGKKLEPAIPIDCLVL